MDECNVAVVEFLVANEELAKAVEPAVRRLHDPASVRRRSAAPGLALLPDAGVVAPRGDGIERRLAGVPTVAKQVHATRAPRSAHEGVEERLELSDIIPVGPGDADRQRDPTPVDQDVPLASIFSPGPSGWVRRTLGRAAP